MTRRAFFRVLPLALVAGPIEERLLDGGRVWEWRGGWLGRKAVRIEAVPNGPPLSAEEVGRARQLARRLIGVGV